MVERGHEPMVWDQSTLSRPVELSLHYNVQVQAHGENLRRRVVTPTVVFTFEGTTGKPVTVRMSVDVLPRMTAAASPYLGPAPEACARTRRVGHAGS